METRLLAFRAFALLLLLLLLLLVPASHFVSIHGKKQRKSPDDSRLSGGVRNTHTGRYTQ
jgi:hypothetical protein